MWSYTEVKMNAERQFETPVQNRFSIFNARENEQREEMQRELSRQDFIQCSSNDKLVHLFDELRHIRQEQCACSNSLAAFHQALTFMDRKVGEVAQVTNVQSDFIRALAVKSIDLEARSRRNNLIVRGIEEEREENCFELVRDFLETKLDIYPEEVRDMYIARAHRLGKRKAGRNFNRRAIIVNFRDYCDVEFVMGRAYLLKNHPGYSVDNDYPKEIQAARSSLWPILKQYRSKNPRSKAKLVYPAKIIADGQVIHDAMPSWSRFINFDRMADIGQVVRHQDASYMTDDAIVNRNEQQRQYQNTQQPMTQISSAPPFPIYSQTQANVHVSVPVCQLDVNNTALCNRLGDTSEVSTGEFINSVSDMPGQQRCRDVPLDTGNNTTRVPHIIEVNSPCQVRAQPPLPCVITPGVGGGQHEVSRESLCVDPTSTDTQTCADGNVHFGEIPSLIRNADSIINDSQAFSEICQQPSVDKVAATSSSLLTGVPHIEDPNQVNSIDSGSGVTRMARAAHRSMKRDHSSSPYRRDSPRHSVTATQLPVLEYPHIDYRSKLADGTDLLEHRLKTGNA